MKTRQQLIRRLLTLRNNGWETTILPYGLSFNEQEANLQQLTQHVRKIEQYRSDHIHKVISTAIRFIAVITILLVIILSHI